MKERWKAIKDYEENYLVSSFGNVINVKTGKLLKPAVHHKGYLLVQLCKEGIKKNMRIHRLVAIAFLSNPENLPEVDHKDTDRKNNKLENLRWVTGSENTRNREVCKKATSQYNGVRLHEKSGKWQVSVWFNRTTKHLGTFTDEILAAKAFNDFCKENKLNRELNILEEV